MNHVFLGWGKLGQKWPSFGLWPKNKSTPLALYLGLLQFISKPWKCHHRNHKNFSKSVQNFSLFVFLCMTHHSYFIHDSYLCEKIISSIFFRIPFFYLSYSLFLNVFCHMAQLYSRSVQLEGNTYALDAHWMNWMAMDEDEFWLANQEN